MDTNNLTWQAYSLELLEVRPRKIFQASTTECIHSLDQIFEKLIICISPTFYHL